MSLDRGARGAEEGHQGVRGADEHGGPDRDEHPGLAASGDVGLDECEPMAQAIAEMAMPATAAIRPKVSSAPTIFSMAAMPGRPFWFGGTSTEGIIQVFIVVPFAARVDHFHAWLRYETRRGTIGWTCGHRADSCHQAMWRRPETPSETKDL